MKSIIKRKNKIITILGLLLLLSGIFILTYHYSTYKKLDNIEEEKIEEFINTDTVIENIEDTSSPTEVATTTKEEVPYIAVLEIPTISLKRGLVSQTSKYNNINYGIKIIDKSTMPDVVNGNLVLASHNGSSYVSFFRNLNKLSLDDKIYVYYNGIKYEYLLSKIYDTPKDGNIEVSRDTTKTTITLITCKRGTKDTQTVYIGYLNSEVSY